jgi:pimeloyl-ACP methyl ester carboxylesterase
VNDTISGDGHERLVIGDHTVNVRQDGPVDAPTLVLVHGFAGSLHVWDGLVPRFAAQRRVVRVDLAGHGETTGPTVDAPEQARLLLAVLDQLDLRKVTLIGHSFGSDVVAATAAISDRVAAVGLLAQAPDYSSAHFPTGGVLMTLPVLGSFLHRFAPPSAVRRTGAWAYAPGFHPSQEVSDQAVADNMAMDAFMFRIILRTRRARLAGHPLDEQLANLKVPTMAVLGAQDRFYGDRPAARYRASGARVEVIAHSGHSPHVEAPELTGRLIEELADQVRS